MKEIYKKSFELYDKMEKKLDEKEYQEFLMNIEKRKKGDIK